MQVLKRFDYFLCDDIHVHPKLVKCYLSSPKDVELQFLANVNSRSRSLYVIARPSVCRLYVCLSVTFVRPTQRVELFDNISIPLVPWPSIDIQ